MNIPWYLTALGAALIWGIHYPLIDFALKRVSVFTMLLVSLFVPGQSVAADAALEIFDGHIHYSSDVWDKLPPQRALELLSEAGITRALVSGTPGEGAERLYRKAPDRVVLRRPASR
jgi:hypothetical protein